MLRNFFAVCIFTLRNSLAARLSSGKPIDWSKFAGINSTNDETTEFHNNVEYFAHPINDTIFECSWRGVEPCGVANFTTTVTDSGVCFTFNNPANKSKILKTSQPGRQNGLFLRMNVAQNEYIFSDESAAGFKVCLVLPDM